MIVERWFVADEKSKLSGGLCSPPLYLAQYHFDVGGHWGSMIPSEGFPRACVSEGWFGRRPVGGW